MPGWTNKGKFNIVEWAFRKMNIPTNLNLALVTSAVAPNADTNTLGELTQIATGNGYADGGYQLNMNDTDFDSIIEDDTNDRSRIQVKDVAWIATGGSIPASGSGARYAVLTDDNATIANREVLIYWDLESDRTVSDGQTLALQDCEIRLNET